MHVAPTVKNILLALPVSLLLTFMSAFIYAFYPLIPPLLAMLFRQKRTGIDAVVGGVGGSSLLLFVFLAEPIFFLIVFSLLDRGNKIR